MINKSGVLTSSEPPSIFQSDSLTETRRCTMILLFQSSLQSGEIHLEFFTVHNYSISPTELFRDEDGFIVEAGNQRTSYQVLSNAEVMKMSSDHFFKPRPNRHEWKIELNIKEENISALLLQQQRENELNKPSIEIVIRPW